MLTARIEEARKRFIHTDDDCDVNCHGFSHYIMTGSEEVYIDSTEVWGLIDGWETSRRPMPDSMLIFNKFLDSPSGRPPYAIHSAVSLGDRIYHRERCNHQVTEASLQDIFKIYGKCQMVWARPR